MKVSIITVCRNAQDYLEGTIQSVLSQTHPDIEYIIIDGASTDGTMAIINKYRVRIAKVVSEPDKGIYDAMNKGLSSATGDILYFLNADDKLFNTTVVENIVREFLSSHTDIVYGKADYWDVPPKIALTLNTKTVQRNSLRDMVLKERAPQQCYFMNKKSFSSVGRFDDTYFIAGDYDWLFRAMNAGMKFKYLDSFVVNFNSSGASYHKRYAAIPEIIKAVFKNTPFPLFLEYVAIAVWRKMIHIFIEEIVTPINQILKKRS